MDVLSWSTSHVLDANLETEDNKEIQSRQKKNEMGIDCFKPRWTCKISGRRYNLVLDELWQYDWYLGMISSDEEKARLDSERVNTNQTEERDMNRCYRPGVVGLLVIHGRRRSNITVMRPRLKTQLDSTPSLQFDHGSIHSGMQKIEEQSLLQSTSRVHGVDWTGSSGIACVVAS